MPLLNIFMALSVRGSMTNVPAASVGIRPLSSAVSLPGWRAGRRIGPLLFAAWLCWLLAADPAAAQATTPPFKVGWRDVTVSRPDGSSFQARLYYPALTTGAGSTYDGRDAPYPAISFGHGFLTSPNYYRGTLRYLASWGYFVIATRSALELFPDHQRYADDLSLSLTYLGNAHSSDSSWLQGQVATDRFGLSGHSMGGGASILAAAADPRVRALANLAAAETRPSATAAMAAVQAPALLIVGSEDQIVPPAVTAAIYTQGTPPRQFAVIMGGSHCGFLDSSPLGCDRGSLPRATQLALTRTLLRDFFNLYLRADQSPWRRIWGPLQNAEPRVVISADPGIQVVQATAPASDDPTLEIVYTLTVTNSGIFSTSYTLLVEDNIWPVSLFPGQTPLLAPDQAIQATATVSLPATLESCQDLDLALVSARSDRDGGTRHFVLLRTELTPAQRAPTLTISRSGDQIALEWQPSPLPQATYQRWRRAGDPYFEPDGACAEEIGCQTVTGRQLVEPMPVAGDHSYLVYAIDCTKQRSGPSNRVGAFTQPILPGEQRAVP